MDIYLANGFAPLVLSVFTMGRHRILGHLLSVAGPPALSGCHSLRLGGNDKPQTTVHQTADLSHTVRGAGQPAAPPSS